MLRWDIESVSVPSSHPQLDRSVGCAFQKISKTDCFDEIARAYPSIVGLVSEPEWEDALFL